MEIEGKLKDSLKKEQEMFNLKTLISYAEFLVSDTEKPHKKLVDLISSAYISVLMSLEVSKSEFAKSLMDMNKEYARCHDIFLEKKPE